MKFHEGMADDLCVVQNALECRQMPAPKAATDASPYYLLPGENKDIRLDVRSMLLNADEWLATPNSNFGGRRPGDLVGTSDEPLLRYTLRSAIYSGMA